jgi:hypothetical protein
MPRANFAARPKDGEFMTFCASKGVCAESRHRGKCAESRAYLRTSICYNMLAYLELQFSSRRQTGGLSGAGCFCCAGAQKVGTIIQKPSATRKIGAAACLGKKFIDDRPPPQSMLDAALFFAY